MATLDDISVQMEAMQALLKAEQEKTALAQLEAGLARQEASRMQDYVVAIPAETSVSGSCNGCSRCLADHFSGSSL